MYTLILAQAVLALALIVFLIWPLYAYLADPLRLRRFPSASIAGFTDLWAVWQQHRHNRTLAVHAAHLRLGPAVRVGTDHVSFSSLQAIRDIYGHGTPMTKAAFYDAFASTHFNISDAREKATHQTKRRRWANPLAQKSVVQLETALRPHLERLITVVDAKAGAELDMSRTVMHLMYDFISTIFYARDLNFLGRDTTVGPAETPSGVKYETDLYDAMIKSSHMSSCMSWLPNFHSLFQYFTQLDARWSKSDRLRDFTLAMVRHRLSLDTARIRAGLPPLDDLFTPMLWDAKTGSPLCLELGELVTESANMVNAAGENTEIATSNIIYHIAANPPVLAKLRAELDGAFDWRQTPIPDYACIKDLPYLRACIDESLRLRPAVDCGLPRVVPEGGMMVDGTWLAGGTVVSVSTHTVHRDEGVFGDSPEKYRPERWLTDEAKGMQRGFLAFSQGGRACIGRNIAYFEMSLVVAVVFSRYELGLPGGGWVLGVEEHFSSHTRALPVGVARRK
ncbi:cytochrome P450 [Coniochaeta ligniaria NRRL 30616]|uniref:Cytochrome P450 n=1 Tax=Coniochaeta ligniaria NRRL 30616 TaxID=1408157 RepID=A0A1J7J266_9PEZI|nr:cytochrome P450 [Coniochaeta ligniaria NRRL 30616]